MRKSLIMLAALATTAEVGYIKRVRRNAVEDSRRPTGMPKGGWPAGTKLACKAAEGKLGLWA